MSIITSIVRRFVAPALPTPPVQYDQRYFDKLLTVFRIYFNQLDGILGDILSSTGTTAVSIGGTNVDAFGRVRSSGPYTLFDSQNRYAASSLFDTSTATGGSTTYLTNESSLQLSVTTSSGSEVVRQSYRSFAYQPGKGLLVLATFVMNTGKTGLRQRAGYFNTQNGVFFQQADGINSFVLRSYVTGSVSDARTVNQSSWNGDKLDGTGDSGLTLDTSKSQILWMDFEWLGVGSVRCGFIINGEYIVCHTFENANSLSNVYMTTAILPVRYEITNTAATASSSSMKQICSTVISEGGYEKRVIPYVARMTTANTGIGTSFVPLVSIRLASGRTGAVVIPDGYSVLPTSASSTTFEVVMVKNPTLTGPSWVASSSANVEQDITATAYTGGTIVHSQYILASNLASGLTSGNGEYNWDMQLGATISGTSDIYTIAVRTTSGTQTAIGTMSFWDLT